MQALYQFDIQGEDVLDYLADFLREADEDEFVRDQADQWTKGAWEHMEQSDSLIVGSTIRWEFSRLSPVDKSILRLAVYQLTHCPDIPPKVVINEAIEIAKKYSTDKSPAFVNGVLDAVLKKLHLPIDKHDT